ncbi:anti-sigma factor [Halomonas sp. ZH2S]|uniref:Anti-sigma factor n=1 Tax=Vreelandella zhuhanensis TaxID=2684210 RepID=A0A7X3KPE6_9GAMM|nr:sigma-E factor negative regulatory protein [Halomonas zhuhanensis]MWJ26758.1 anti-sigma factor [Halomonas zhuhanensis]
MSHDTRESLSALMDDEGDELELRRVLKALPSDTDAADTWRRYHLARSLMQREHGVDVSTDLSAGIMARLQEEPAPAAQAPPQTGHRVSFVRGAGVAAAVSLMVLAGVQFYGGGASEDGDNLVASSPQSPYLPSGDAERQVRPVNLGTASGAQSAGMANNVPMFEQTPFRVSGQAGRSGLMNVTESGFSVSQAPQGLSRRQAEQSDIEQIRLLQSYLDRHAQGAAYGSGDSWMPLLRASSSSIEPQSQR